MSSKFFTLAFALLLTAAVSSMGQAAEADQTAPRYQPLGEIPPQPEDADLLFFFWYGSMGSYQVELQLQKLLQQRPQLTLVRVPLIARPSWRIPARWFAASQTLGLLPQLHTNWYQCSLTQEQCQLAQVLSPKGVTAEQWEQALNDRRTLQTVKRAEQLAADYAITQVPTIIVRNQWITDADMNGTAAQVIDTITQLLDDASGND